MKFCKKLGIGLLSLMLLCQSVSVSATELVSDNAIGEPDSITIDVSDELIKESQTVDSASATCLNDLGNNSNAQSYGVYSYVMESFLQPTSDGKLMLVRANTYSSSGYLTVAYYDSSYRFISAKQVAPELPLFGCFYSDGNYYYVVSGQKNPNESNSLEVYRITKYDTNWNRLGSCGLYGANTYIPFDAGSCRVTHTGNNLVVRTCHEMYASSDGKHHQASVTIVVNTSNMSIIGSTYNVANSSLGYISHSFNQFVHIDNGKIVAVDHGDAYPRSIVLLNYEDAITSGSFSPYASATYVFDFEGATGNNYTGASVGGFEVSGTHYLVAGSSAPEGTAESNLSSARRNIFLYAVNKSTGSISKRWLTNDAASNGSYSTPQLVSSGNGRYMILFSRSDTIYYASVNADGSFGQTYSMSGSLSDCKPIVQNQKVTWFTTSGANVTFYEIPLSNLSKGTSHTTKADHSYQQTSNDGSAVQLKCSQCGDIKSVPIASTVWLLFGTDVNENGCGSYSSVISSEQPQNSMIYGCIYGNFDDSAEFELSSDNPDAVVVEMTSDRYFKLYTKNCGVAKITAKQRYIDKVCDSVTFCVSHNKEDIVHHPAVEATTATDGCKEYWTCNSCGGTYSDATGSKPTTLEKLKIPAKGSNSSDSGSDSDNDWWDDSDDDWTDDGCNDNDCNDNSTGSFGESGYCFSSYQGNDFYIDDSGNVRCYDTNGNMIINDFKCDGTYTYYFQANGTAMKNRLTYHPDGVHIIYFDESGHEVFSDFANVKRSIAGEPVDDMCFFNVYGYMYVDTLTYDKTGTKLYYVNPYGVLERNGWFEFSGNEFNAGIGFSGRAGGYGYANPDCSLLTNTPAVDWLFRFVYIQGDGHMFPQ